MAEYFDFDLGRVVKAIHELDCRKVLLQFPEGLKRQAPDVAAAISQKTNARIAISGEPCFGACDIPDTDADLIVHYGHLPIPNLANSKSVLYIQARSSADPLPVLEKALPGLGGKIGLLTTAQHIHLISEMTIFIRSKGIDVVIGKGDSRIYADGQVLGCNASSARSIADAVDSFLFVGTGDFHPLAVALATSKPVLIADPVSSELRDIAAVKDRVLRQRHAAIEIARAARRFGIIISSKQGQRREAVAARMAEVLASAGHDPILVEMGLVTPGKLDSIGLDAWVSTACPRLAIDDHVAFSRPVLTPPEAEIMVGKRAWSDYVFDEIV